MADQSDMTEYGVWQPIESAPRDTDVLVLYDHKEDPYMDPKQPNKLTPYATWADCGDFLSGAGFCVAKWFPQQWESEDEYGSGYWMPAWWFSRENDDYVRVVNATHWMPLPPAPTSENR